MSERMTQERLTWFRLRRREVEAMGLRVDPLVVELHDEVEGAKASEAQKDATIKALADALEAAKRAMWRGEFGDKGRDKGVPEQVDAALRLAGRL